MKGIIDVGGGLRGIYAAGVLDSCIDSGIHFDYAVGVSAGSANLSAFLAGQRGRNVSFYTNYSFRREYMSWHNFFRKKNYVDLDYVYGTLSNSGGEYPLDFGAIQKSGTVFKIVATEVETALPHYFDARVDMDWDDYGAISASCALPILNRPYLFRGNRYFDGGLSDPIPFHLAAEAGCDKIVVILTRPKDFYRLRSADQKYILPLKIRYPEIANAMRNRAELYNTQLDEAKELERQGKALIVAPDSIEGMKTLTKDYDVLVDMYSKGLKDGKKIPEFLEK